MKSWNWHQHSAAVTHFSNNKLTKWQEQQVSVVPALTYGTSSTIGIELSNTCIVFVFECGQPGLQSSTAVVGSCRSNSQNR